jgi:hypothetical protein
MNAVSYEEQIYLLHFWLRSNLINFVPTLENVKKELFLEFGIEDEKVYQEVYELFHV